MKRLFISKENLKILVDNLKNNCDEFIAPKKEHLGDIIFGNTKESNDELINYTGNSVISPRAFLLPQSEVLFEITSVRSSSFSQIEDKKKRIFYGVRPCDIKAIGLMRRFFLGDIKDEFYKEKNENSLFISLACTQRCLKDSFCYEMNSGPVAEEGFDLQLIALNDGYLVEIGSKKGNSIIKNNKKLFTKASSSKQKPIKDIFKNFAKDIKQIDFGRLSKMIEEDKVKESVWNDIGLRCVVCSGCTTLCPTCSCFSIADRLDGDKGIRLRYCDGCPYAGFTRMAGGSIPQPLHKDHIRRFFEHKLSVDVERYGTSSCVGCARCINTCPGNISIKNFIKEVLK